VNGPRIGTRHGGSCGALRPACPQHRAIPMNVIWLNALSQRQRAMSADLIRCDTGYIDREDAAPRSNAAPCG
jgi:hypothetical protein